MNSAHKRVFAYILGRISYQCLSKYLSAVVQDLSYSILDLKKITKGEKVMNTLVR